jgi:1,4-dihydroxy-2-naphthoate octaprenyltransferase
MIGGALAWSDAAAFYEAGTFSWTAFILCLLFAFVMQIDANFINDFVDYARGTDDRETRLGPERACTQGWVSIEAMKRAIALTTCLACVVGLPLVWYGGMEMVAVGLVCVLFCFLYTTHLSYMGLGDVLVLVFFGLVPVCITYYVLLHTITLLVVVSAVACGLVIDALLLVNNFRDRDTDRVAGKRTLVVRIGAKPALWLYLAVGIVACLLGIAFIFYGHWMAFVLPMLYLLLHFITFLKIKSIWQGREINRCLGQTARNIFIYGLLVSLGLLL